MAAETAWGGAPPVLRLILGRQLEELRTRAGLTYDQAGAVIGVSHSTIRRMESAKVARLRLPDVEKLLRTYGVTDQRELDTFLKSVREANKRGWWHTYRDVMPDWFAAYLSLEQAALQIRGYEAQFVHGLLQTEDYARALLSAGHPHAAPEATERRVALRMQRQELLTRETPPRVWVVMDETVLRWPVGGAAVMRAQIDHLIEVSALPHVTVQIMPFRNGPHPAMPAGAFDVFRFRAKELPDIVYLSGLVGAVYLDKEEDVVVYREVLDRLGAQSVPARKTEDVLGAIRKEL
ncbi:helix-turn-helix transcriptional regulator [Streptomyces luomodiensis]|uniref:Helix-turn-helix transcriptional regulator n=1 Tax=Streptomyces luomodiensis TaxID=3026192 RepID=A0ABY9V963_9ACTN|nr:helix-turn-helix transcriptional regulator [Streptomyces sp. SCA4-21]WNF00189.1 helix-turn-helix transcriptional regulator [Streptomyces sp. SCA4-21]